jgi:hypothetical protein
MGEEARGGVRMEKKCVKCGDPIPQERLENLPGTQTCVKCSDVEKRIGFTAWEETTPELVIVNPADFERLQKFEGFDGRQSRLK